MKSILRCELLFPLITGVLDIHGLSLLNSSSIDELASSPCYGLIERYVRGWPSDLQNERVSEALNLIPSSDTTSAEMIAW